MIHSVTCKTYCGLCNGIVSGETYTIDTARHYAISDMSYVQKRYWLIKYVGRLLIWLYFFYFRYASKNYGLVMTRQALTVPMIAIWTEFLSRAVGRFGMFTIVAAFPSVSAATESHLQYHLNSEYS